MPLLFFSKVRSNPTQDETQFEKTALALALSYLDKGGHHYQRINKHWQAFILHEMPVTLAHYQFQHQIVPHCPVFQNVARQNFQFKVLSGGLTNFTFKLDVLSQEEKPAAYVYRIPGVGSEKFIDRKKEKHNALLASESKLSPEIIYFDEQNGMQVSRFLSNPEPMSVETFKNPDNINRAAELLRALHETPEPFAHDANTFERNHKFLQLILEKSPLPEKYAYLKNDIDTIEIIFATLFNNGEVRKVPCHNDTTPPNFVISNNIMRLIDLEYSGQNDALWDLANLSGDAEFTPEQDEQLLQAYFTPKELTLDIKNRFQLYKPVVEYYTILWCQLQIVNKNFIGNAGFQHLLQLSDKRLQQAEAILNRQCVNDAVRYFQKKHMLNSIQENNHCMLRWFSRFNCISLDASQEKQPLKTGLRHAKPF